MKNNTKYALHQNRKDSKQLKILTLTKNDENMGHSQDMKIINAKNHSNRTWLHRSNSMLRMKSTQNCTLGPLDFNKRFSNITSSSQSNQCSKLSNPNSKLKPFIYYLSEVLKEYEDQSNQKEAERQGIFLDHLMHAMYILKSKKFETPPLTFTPVQKNHAYLHHEKTLVFDLDETLIHCGNAAYSKFYPDQEQIFLQVGNDVISYYVNIRPYAKQVLKRLSKKFNLLIFTASQEPYAEKVLQIIDPDKELFKGRYYRQHCYQNHNKQHIKDLRILSRNLSQLLIVDNSPTAYCFQKDNAVPIIPFIDDIKDDQLLKLEEFMTKQILKVKDIPKFLNKKFKISEYCNYSTVKELLQNIELQKT